MNQQRKLSRHNSRQSSICETTSVGSTLSGKSIGSNEFPTIINNNNISAYNNNNNASRKSSSSNGVSKQSSQDSGTSGQYSAPLPSSIISTTVTTNGNSNSILNVAEMLLHGVADNEILDIWLKSIQCEEFVAKFIDAGYDMPTISRITPQDLTAIGVTDPTKRLKILAEIKKLNLQDGIPNFKPTTLSHWLSLIRLESYYYKSLCDQQIDTIEKMCQLTWEDFEELGITKLGHQKRFQLAIERVKEMDSSENKNNIRKPISEPIYDTNPSQILLVASSENHSMNGPIINKQSSTSELSSTGSGSMHSVYSSASTQYQPTYAAPSIPDNNNSCRPSNGVVVQVPTPATNNNANLTQSHQHQQQAIYNQPPSSQIIYQQLSQVSTSMPPTQQQQYHPIQQPQQLSQMQNSPTHFGRELSNSNCNGNTPWMMPHLQQNRQSMSQLPFSALAKLPKHQQQILQQSSIYATLSRQPSSKPKQPPPPVPIRTNSLKPNFQQTPQSISQINNNNNIPISADTLLQQQQQASYQQSQLNNCHTTSTSSLFRLSGNRVSNRNQLQSQTMLTKNKSFSGNAHMEASRARFLNRNSQQHTHLPSQQIQTFMSNDAAVELSNSNQDQNQHNHHNNHNNHHHQQLQNHIQNLPLYHQVDDFDQNSDTQSTKSSIAPSSNSLITSPVDNNNPLNNSPSQDSGSSQTLYNSVSSGSNDQSLNIYNSPQAEKLALRSAATASSCTLNDANHFIMDSNQHQQHQQKRTITKSSNFLPSAQGLPLNSNNCTSSISNQCNATTGKDDDFPPPPSPLSLTDFDENDHLVSSLNSNSSSNSNNKSSSSNSNNNNNNFTDSHHGLMTFRVGI